MGQALGWVAASHLCSFIGSGEQGGDRGARERLFIFLGVASGGGGIGKAQHMGKKRPGEGSQVPSIPHPHNRSKLKSRKQAMFLVKEK